MYLVGSEKPNVHLRCAIASELLDELESISPRFSIASSPIWLHHLAHIGHIISSAIPSSSPTRTYFLVQSILQALAEFLENIDIELSRLSHPRIAAKLRAQVSQIDQCRQQASEQDPQRRLSAQSLPLEALKTSGPAYNDSLNVTSDRHGGQEADFSGATNIDLQSAMQTSGPDIDFPPISSTSHSTDLFENWPMLAGNTDVMDPVGAFLSLGQVLQDS
ncbi:uncharacterized protein N7483_012020 [Penicillium malachiteum]|uniref:uncharacterized protein n=1 Tax=Penicillium malachiteum TaxID=1324776 RepID=UPI0025495FBD|nr:uncharacterized protein N7483_012020 [Penicillium malachiteum]KAJ5714839.1 hypothetical protein N7483_012020 [Penicillium malachiteum]